MNQAVAIGLKKNIQRDIGRVYLVPSNSPEGDNMAQVHIKRYLPLLRFSLEIPFVSIYTAVINEAVESYMVEYVSIYWKIWKWSGSFRLYDSMHRQISR